jgi:hypothetical protein
MFLRQGLRREGGRRSEKGPQKKKGSFEPFEQARGQTLEVAEDVQQNENWDRHADHPEKYVAHVRNLMSKGVAVTTPLGRSGFLPE